MKILEQVLSAASSHPNLLGVYLRDDFRERQELRDTCVDNVQSV